MIGWDRGVIDYTTTIYWYGDCNAQAIGYIRYRRNQTKIDYPSIYMFAWDYV